MMVLCGNMREPTNTAYWSPAELPTVHAVAPTSYIMIILGKERGQELTSDMTRRDKHGTMGNGKTVTYA